MVRKVINDSAVMTTEQAARYLGLAKNTLEQMRVSGKGPHFVSPNSSVRYLIGDLDQWMHRNRFRSTHERRKARSRG